MIFLFGIPITGSIEEYDSANADVIHPQDFSSGRTDLSNLPD